MDAKTARELDKKRKAERNRLQKRESDLLGRIGELDDEKAETVAAMSLPGNYSDGARMRALQAQADEIEAATARLSSEWEETAAELEAYADLQG